MLVDMGVRVRMRIRVLVPVLAGAWSEAIPREFLERLQPLLISLRFLLLSLATRALARASALLSGRLGQD